VAADNLPPRPGRRQVRPFDPDVADDPLATWRWLVRIRRQVIEVYNGTFYGLMEWLRSTDADAPQKLRLSTDHTYNYLLWVELREFFEGQLNYKQFVKFSSCATFAGGATEASHLQGSVSFTAGSRRPSGCINRSLW